MKQKSSIAFFSPFSPLRSGVSHYSEELAKELCDDFAFTFYSDKGYIPTVVGKYGDVKEFRDFNSSHDLNFFQASNNSIHSYMYPYLLKHPGVITLHDFTISSMVRGHWTGRKKLMLFYEVLYSHGWDGAREVLGIRMKRGLRSIIRHKPSAVEGETTGLTFVKRAIDSSRGIVVHSQQMVEIVRQIDPARELLLVPLGVEQVAINHSKEESRKCLGLDRFGIDDESFVILSFGFIARSRRIDKILMAFKDFVRDYPNSFYIICGPRMPQFEIDSFVAKHGLDGKVVIIDSYIPMEKVNEHINASDLCFNLRWPAFGSSSSLMKMMAVGRPCVVTNVSPLNEFPDTILMRIDADLNETQNLLKVMRKIRDNKDLGRQIGNSARAYINQNCLWSIVAQQYRDFLEKFI